MLILTKDNKGSLIKMSHLSVRKAQMRSLASFDNSISSGKVKWFL